MKVYVDDSPAGMGKTYRAIDRICRCFSKVVLITERKVSFPELEQAIHAAATRHGTTPLIRHIHGDTGNRGLGVAKEIEALPELYSVWPHVVVIATHAALLRSDFAGFTGWEMVIDEVPAFLDFEEKDTHLDRAYFERYYALEQIVEGWHAVQLTDEGRTLTVADVRADQSHGHLAVFHARVIEADRPAADRHVLCNIPDWAAMANRRVRWCWASVFSLKQLQAFDRVELLGNRFLDNIGSVLARRFDGDDVEWEVLPPLAQTRPFVHRDVEITYFTERPAARSLFETADGQRALMLIGEYLGKVLPKGHSIWTANDSADRGLPSPKSLITLPVGDFLPPRQAGTNRYQTISHAAMIYTAKPCPNLRGLLLAVDIEPDIWTRSIEYEAILQFMTRTSVRDPGNGRPVRFWVFDRGQAMYLKDYFDRLSHISVSISCAGIALDLPAKRPGGRPAAIRTPAEQVAYEADRRRRDADRKRLARRKAA